MSTANLRSYAWVVTMAIMLLACSTNTKDVPALIAAEDEATHQAIITALKEVLGTQDIALGPNAREPTESIVALPAPLSPTETHSVAMPEVFDAVFRGNNCYLVRRSTNFAFKIEKALCTRVSIAP
jgi:hypothetical protein